MREREEDEFDAGVGERCSSRRGRPAGSCWPFAPRASCGWRCSSGMVVAGIVGRAAEEEGSVVCEARVGEQQAGEFAAGVATDSGDCGASGGRVQ